MIDGNKLKLDPFADLIDLCRDVYDGRASPEDLEGYPPVEGSVGSCLPALMMPGTEIAIHNEEAFEQTPVAKPTSSAKRRTTRGSRWRSQKITSRYNWKTEKFEPCSKTIDAGKELEDLTVDELQAGIPRLG